jgi:DNA-binding NarL/FixJ family response regulator
MRQPLAQEAAQSAGRGARRRLARARLLDSGLVTRRRTSDPLQRLTDRDGAVLPLMAEGRSNAGIAGRLYLSPKGVERHISAGFDRARPAARQRRQSPGPGRHGLP